MKLYVFALFCGFIYICRPTYISKDFQIHSYFIILDFFLFLPNNKYVLCFPIEKKCIIFNWGQLFVINLIFWRNYSFLSSTNVRRRHWPFFEFFCYCAILTNATRVPPDNFLRLLSSTHMYTWKLSFLSLFWVWEGGLLYVYFHLEYNDLPHSFNIWWKFTRLQLCAWVKLTNAKGELMERDTCVTCHLWVLNSTQTYIKWEILYIFCSLQKS